jgi:hypothetical protein
MGLYLAVYYTDRKYSVRAIHLTDISSVTGKLLLPAYRTFSKHRVDIWFPIP